MRKLWFDVGGNWIMLKLDISLGTVGSMFCAFSVL